MRIKGSISVLTGGGAPKQAGALPVVSDPAAQGFINLFLNPNVEDNAPQPSKISCRHMNSALDPNFNFFWHF